jgi:hypothetical protein
VDEPVLAQAADDHGRGEGHEAGGPERAGGAEGLDQVQRAHHRQGGRDEREVREHGDAGTVDGSAHQRADGRAAAERRVQRPHDRAPQVPLHPAAVGRPVLRPRGTERLWLLGVVLTGLVLVNVALVRGSKHAQPAVLGVAAALTGLVLGGPAPRPLVRAGIGVVAAGLALGLTEPRAPLTPPR